MVLYQGPSVMYHLMETIIRQALFCRNIISIDVGSGITLSRQMQVPNTHGMNPDDKQSPDHST